MILLKHQVLNSIFSSGSKVAGHRGFFLLDAGLELNQALISYGLDFLKKRNYTKIMTPFFMKKEMMAKTAQLSQFDEELYKVVEKERGAGAKEDAGEKTEESEDKYLIATSEQPISCFHSGETFHQPEKDLPIKYFTTFTTSTDEVLTLFEKGTLATRPVSEKRLALLAEIHGAFSEFISLKKWNNSA